MRIYRVFVSILCLCVYSDSFSQTTNTKSRIDKLAPEKKLELTFALPGLKEGESVQLRKFFYPFTETSWVFVDSVTVRNGTATFEHKLEDGPRLFSISFSAHNNYIVVALDNEKVTVRGDKDLDAYLPEGVAGSIGEFLKFDGSKTADEFLYLDYAVFRVWSWSVEGINASIRSYKDSLRSKPQLERIAGLIEAKDRVYKSVRESLMYPKVKRLTPELFQECRGEMMRDSLWLAVYKNLDDEAKQTYNGRIMKEYLPLIMGQTAPDLSFVSSEKKEGRLSETAKRNKLTILHFWSNGSADRKIIHKDLAEVYKKYHTKGLEVVSISFDGNENKWKKIVHEDNIPGIQTCDFKEEESPYLELYKIHPKSTINILIDQRGKMIAYDVDGPALFGHLYRIFGE